MIQIECDPLGALWCDLCCGHSQASTPRHRRSIRTDITIISKIYHLNFCLHFGLFYFLHFHNFHVTGTMYTTSFHYLLLKQYNSSPNSLLITFTSHDEMLPSSAIHVEYSWLMCASLWICAKVKANKHISNRITHSTDAQIIIRIHQIIISRSLKRFKQRCNIFIK